MSEPAEKIYGWLNTQLSIARHYGGIKVNGHNYVIDYEAEGQPLVLEKPKTKNRTKPLEGSNQESK